MDTLWGHADRVTILAKGLTDVNTPSHGGIIATKCWGEANLSEAARNAGEKFRDGWAYEEDCKWSIVYYEHPELFPAGTNRAAAESALSWEVEYCHAVGLPVKADVINHLLRFTHGARRTNLLNILATIM
ncbi:MAG: hypothetical protein DDT21_01869 [Syntrophomonadaceae bacterium]|nr:hypothetical protein [Bacillota bacterium]